MKKLLLILPFAALFCFVSAQQRDDRQLTAAFDKLLSEQFKSNETGAAALVSKNGKIVYKKAFGLANVELNVPMQSDNVFRIGSITKQITAVAILQLMEQGKLNLQDEITKFIPDYPTQGTKITIEHLLTHTSGIRNFSTIRDTVQFGRLDQSPKQMINHFKNQPMRFAPGTRWEYSNSGYFLLGYIIEQITGMSYAQYIEEKFFKPLGMNNSLYANDIRIVKNRAAGYAKPDKVLENASFVSLTQPYAAGSVQSSVEDLFKWQQAVQSYKLIKKETLDKAWSRYILTDGNPTSYGYGWRQGYIQGSASLWHGGLIQGYMTMAMYLPEQDVFVTVLTNCECNSPVDITAKLAALAIGKPYEASAITLDKNILQGYAGVYENKEGQLRIITLSGDQLYAQTGRSPKSLIKAVKKDQFFFENDAMTTMDFIRNSKGEVEQLITKSRTMIETWSKTNKPIPSEDGIKLDEKILDTYVGVYEITPEFGFTIIREKDRMFVQATGQEKFEIFAETETKFFVKINDAQMEFLKDASGKVIKVALLQGGRKNEARKVR